MSRRKRAALWGGGVLVLLLVAGFTAWQAWTVRSSLLAARADLEEVAQRLADDDQGGALRLAEDAEAATGRADRHSHTPLWWAAQVLPVIGDDVTAVRAVSAGAHDLTEGVVTPVIEAGFSTEDFKPVDGRLRLEPLLRADEVLDRAAREVSGVDESVGNLETDGLLSPLKGPVEELQGVLTTGARITRGAAIATDLLPQMLGEDEPRQYLLAFQNNAEPRALGGLVGTLGVLKTDRGKVDLARTFAPGELENGKGVIRLGDAERELFSPRLSLFAKNASSTPHFPRAAKLLQAFWDRAGRQPIDGVVAIDPVALSYLLEYTGDIELADGSVLSADNAVDLLLSESYEMYEPERQDLFFARAANAIFDEMLTAQGPVDELVAALDRSIRERRISLWSVHEDQQALIAGETIANELSQDSGPPSLGVYLNNQVPDKLGYYLRSEVEVEPEGCDAAGVQTMNVTVSMRSTVPADHDLPGYVVDPVPDAPLGTMVYNVLLFAPAGGEIVEASAEEETETGVQLGERPVGLTRVQLEPGESTTLEYVVLSGDGQLGDISLATTPLADGTGGEVVKVPGCDAG